MASSPLIPKNGAVTLAGYLMDFASFDLESAMSVENVTPYGSNTCSKNIGSGTPDFSASVGAFALAHTTSTPLKMDTLAATGAAAVFTLDTGVSEAATMVVQSLRVSHARMRGSVP